VLEAIDALLTTSVKSLPGFYVVNVSSGLDGNVFAVLEARPEPIAKSSRSGNGDKARSTAVTVR